MECRDFRDLMSDEEGMGTVEIILIIVGRVTGPEKPCFMWKNDV